MVTVLISQLTNAEVAKTIQSDDKKTEVLTICGYIDKESFFEKADFFAEGTKRTRTDGTSFKTKADLYEIVQNKLNSAGSIEDILNGIK